MLVASKPLHRELSAFYSIMAGLLTSPRSKAPSRTNGNGICFVAIRGLTAAGQSGIFTPFPLNRG